MRGISWLAANQLASQEGLCTMEWVSKSCWLSASDVRMELKHVRFFIKNKFKEQCISLSFILGKHTVCFYIMWWSHFKMRTLRCTETSGTDSQWLGVISKMSRKLRHTASKKCNFQGIFLFSESMKTRRRAPPSSLHKGRAVCKLDGMRMREVTW